MSDFYQAVVEIVAFGLNESTVNLTAASIPTNTWIMHTINCLFGLTNNDTKYATLQSIEIETTTNTSSSQFLITILIRIDYEYQASSVFDYVASNLDVLANATTHALGLVRDRPTSPKLADSVSRLVLGFAHTTTTPGGGGVGGASSSPRVWRRTIVVQNPNTPSSPPTTTTPSPPPSFFVPPPFFQTGCGGRRPVISRGCWVVVVMTIIVTTFVSTSVY